MTTYLTLLIKGFFLGIAKVMPGVSGSLLAISLNVYDLGINSLANILKEPRKNIPIVFSLGAGVILSITIFSKIIYIILNRYYFVFILFFLGLICGGYKSIINKTKYNKKNIIIFNMTLIITTIFLKINSILIVKNNNVNFCFFLGGIFEAIGSLVPGISSSFFLMLLGIYDTVMFLVSNIFNYGFIFTNINIILSFIIGLFVGILIICKVINYVLKKYSSEMYSSVLAIYIISFFSILIKLTKLSFSNIQLLLGIFLCIIGFYLSGKLDKIC